MRASRLCPICFSAKSLGTRDFLSACHQATRTTLVSSAGLEESGDKKVSQHRSFFGLLCFALLCLPTQTAAALIPIPRPKTCCPFHTNTKNYTSRLLITSPPRTRSGNSAHLLAFILLFFSFSYSLAVAFAVCDVRKSPGIIPKFMWLSWDYTSLRDIGNGFLKGKHTLSINTRCGSLCLSSPVCTNSRPLITLEFNYRTFYKHRDLSPTDLLLPPSIRYREQMATDKHTLARTRTRLIRVL